MPIWERADTIKAQLIRISWEMREKNGPVEGGRLFSYSLNAPTDLMMGNQRVKYAVMQISAGRLLCCDPDRTRNQCRLYFGHLTIRR